LVYRQPPLVLKVEEWGGMTGLEQGVIHIEENGAHEKIF